MAEDSPSKRPGPQGDEDDPDDGPSPNKKPRLEETQQGSTSPTPAADEAKEVQEPRDPGKKEYREINKYLKGIKVKLAEERSEDTVLQMRDLLKKLEGVCTSAVGDGEVPNPLKIIQMHVKYVLFNSEKVKDGDNIKNFLNGLEDSSASTSDKDGAVYVFLANFATEIWYCWNDNEAQWQWTPEKWTEEKKWWLWMPCSTTVVTAGQWKDETPAPENVEIINYLDAVRPVPSDEPYLPQNFDVVELLKKLVELCDDHVTASLKVILETIASQEVQSKSCHVTEFLGEVNTILKEVSSTEDQL